jgi:uncharacterized Zn-finger protein
MPSCVSDALVTCNVPGFGSPPPDPGTCRFAANSRMCDATVGYDIHSGAVHTRGNLCLAVSSVPPGPGWALPERWTDASGQLIALVYRRVWVDEKVPYRVECAGDLAGDAAAAGQDIDTTDATCVAAWRAFYDLPHAWSPIGREGHLGCPYGECPDPLSP